MNKGKKCINTKMDKAKKKKHTRKHQYKNEQGTWKKCKPDKRKVVQTSLKNVINKKNCNFSFKYGTVSYWDLLREGDSDQWATGEEKKHWKGRCFSVMQLHDCKWYNRKMMITSNKNIELGRSYGVSERHLAGPAPLSTFAESVPTDFGADCGSILWNSR